MSPNDKTYTEVVLEFTQMLTASESRQTTHNGEVITQLARGDEKFKAIYDKLDGEGGINERIGDAEDDIKTNTKNIRIVGGIEAALLMLGGWLGFRQ
jgi:hypothetical protein